MIEFEQLSFLDDEKPLFKIKKPIRLIELFAGVGSQAMALRDLGVNFEHYRAVEFDKYAIKSYNAIHSTDFPIMDITKINGCDLGIVDIESFTYLLTPSLAKIYPWLAKEKEVVQYIGIAVDEPKRIDRIADTKNKVSLLEKYGYTEEMAKEKCIEYGLLSPIYEFTNRGGCWFCPNARDCELRHLRNNHRDLWDKLLELEETPNLIGNKWNTLTQTSIHDKEEQFMWEDRQMNIFDYLN